MTESPAAAIEFNESDPIAEALATASEMIKELTANTATTTTPWLYSKDIPLPKGLLVLAYTAPPEGIEVDRPSEFIVRQLSNSFLPGGRVREVISEYRWSAIEPYNRDHQYMTQPDPNIPGKLNKRKGFEENDAKSIKKLAAKAKKFLAPKEV